MKLYAEEWRSLQLWREHDAESGRLTHLVVASGVIDRQASRSQIRLLSPESINNNIEVRMLMSSMKPKLNLRALPTEDPAFGMGSHFQPCEVPSMWLK